MSTKVAAIVTKEIQTALAEGTIPWQKPWIVTGQYNGVSGKVYRGFNQFALAMWASRRGLTSTCWLTLKQIKKFGGRVKDDQFKQGCPISWAHIVDEEQDDGTTERVFKGMRFYTVYNLTQLEDPPAMEDQVKEAPEKMFGTCDLTMELDERAEQVLLNMPDPPALQHGGSRACYTPANDTVSMPLMEYFKKFSQYYKALFHELGHSTGSASRLNRKDVTSDAGFGTVAYSREELTAEMCSAMICHLIGLEWDVPNTAAYIASWSNHLKGKSGDLVAAANRAWAAVEYIMGSTDLDNSKGE